MKPLPRIDFVAPRGPAPLARGLLMVAAAALAWQGGLAWQAQRALEHQRAGLAAAARPASTAPSSASPQQRRQQAHLDQVARHLAAPWDELLALFEQHGAGEVALVRLQPDASTGLVNLLARARNRRVMMAYVIALEADARLASVLLTHHEVLSDVDGAPLQFSLSAVWRPGAAQRARSALQESAP